MVENQVGRYTCKFPNCGARFRKRSNSSRAYCDLHLGGREHGGVVKTVTADEIITKYQSLAKPLPPVPKRIKAVRVADMDLGGRQESIACFSDLHWGSRIDPRVTAGLAEYNLPIAKSRLVRWRDGVLRFAQMDQALLKIDTLHLLALGDDIEGHGEMFDTQRLSMTDSVGFQLFGLIDYLPEVLLSFLQRYKKIKVYKVRGNHGRISAKRRGDYPPDNLELTLWDSVANRVAKEAGGKWSETSNGIRTLTGGKIDFYISPAFMMFVDIMGHSFAIRHGDGVGGVTRTYTGLVDNKLRLNAIVGSIINYYIIAHHHEASQTEHEIGGESIVNGCFVGPSLLSLTMGRPAANIPSQELFLVHPKYGLTHRHRVRLATVEEMRSLTEWVGR